MTDSVSIQQPPCGVPRPPHGRVGGCGQRAGDHREQVPHGGHRGRDRAVLRMIHIVKLRQGKARDGER